jgi:hypothetical protein
MNKVWPIILLALLLYSCRKEHSQKNQSLYIINDSTVNVAINGNQTGRPIATNFEGLSFETSMLITNPAFLNADNKVFIQLLKNLGPGMLRLGGASSDFISWSNAPRTGSTPDNVLTTSDVDRLSAFSKASGWPVLFGFNLANNDPAMAATEATYVDQSLGDNLYAFQAGNEPDAYGPYTHHRDPGYTLPDYISDFTSYLEAVQKAVPTADFAGPGIAFNTSWISTFAGSKGGYLKLLDGHYYEAGPATDLGITYQLILGTSFKLPTLISAFQDSPFKDQLPYRVTESNNIYGGGKPGVSDVFASAIWALDVMWTLADNGCQGINFHTGTNLYYSPVVNENGQFVTRPEYYAMLAFRYGSANGNLVSLNTDDSRYCTAHASKIGGNYTVTLINKSIDKSYYFNIIPGMQISSVKVSRLTAPSLTATAGVKFAGSTVNTDGTFSPSATESYTVNDKRFTVNVPAGSAAVVTIQ